jgi:hypothetical protein
VQNHIIINDCYHHDRFCHWRIYCLWHGHGACFNNSILDKKMNAYELAEYLKAFVADKTDYDQDYLIHAAQVLILQAHEIKALREQLIEAQL